MRRIITNVFLLIFVVGAWVYGTTDEMESLIEKQKPAPAETPDEGPPAAFLMGNSHSVTIYSSALYAGQPSLLCESFPFDELIDMSEGDPLADETVLNMNLPRVHDTVEQSCLIRPTDEILAVGPGWQSWVQITDFVVRRGPAVCPDDSPYSLLGRFDHELAWDPLFYSTDPDLKEGSNGFAPLVFLRGTSPLLKTIVSDLSDFEVSIATVSAPNVDAFFLLKRRHATPDDDGLANQILLWSKGDTAAVLNQENVDVTHGSGHLNLGAVFDYNGDGFLDVWVEGDQQKCSYHLLYQGAPDGFTPVEMPNAPCSC